MFLGVGVGYPHNSWVVPWVSRWFLRLLLGGFMTSDKKVKA